MENSALILEGGGMRGIFTSGVLDAFLDHDIDINYVIGVSMGAYTGLSYITKQGDRNKKVLIECMKNKEFFDFKRTIKGEPILDSNFVFNVINKKIFPFDYSKFYESEKEFVCVATDAKTGKPAYFSKNDPHFEKGIKASCSYPGITELVNIDEDVYIDGGVADPIPIRKAILEDKRKLVVVLTRPKDYQEEFHIYYNLSNIIYKKYPKLIKILKRRHNDYNSTLNLLEQLEKLNIAFVIRPEDMELGVLTKDYSKIDKYYDHGYRIGTQSISNLKKFLGI